MFHGQWLSILAPVLSGVPPAWDRVQVKGHTLAWHTNDHMLCWEEKEKPEGYCSGPSRRSECSGSCGRKMQRSRKRYSCIEADPAQNG